MKCRHAWVVILLLGLSAAYGQNTFKITEPTPANPSDLLQPGIVVESVSQGTAGQKAGLREGDIMLAWIQSDSRGEISSPFDFSAVEVEQAPRGAVTLEGIRGTEHRTWFLV